MASRRASPLGTFVPRMRTNVPMKTASDAISYDDLYSRWERGNWRAMEIDFSEDARQWQEVFTDFEREAALWNYALFFWGEDAVADGLSPYIDAAPLEEQKYFLATQQVDEARHAVFFSRFMHEVAGIGAVRHRLAAGGHRAAADLGLQEGLRPARDHVRGAPAQADAADAGGGGHALPHRHRGNARAAGPALHHELPRGAPDPARLPLRHGAGRPGRAAPHRLRRQAARRPLPPGPGLPLRGRRPAARGDPLDGRRARAAALGPPLHRGLRLHARGDRRRGRELARDQAAQRRPAAGGAARPLDLLHRARRDGARAHGPAARVGRDPRREDGAAEERPRDDGGALPDDARRASTTTRHPSGQARSSGSSRTRSPGTSRCRTATRAWRPASRRRRP